MGKAVLTVLVLISIGWMVYGGFYLIQSSSNPYAPEIVFGKEDGALLIVNRPQEFDSFNQFKTKSSNKYIDNLSTLKNDEYPNVTYFVSQNRSSVVFEKSDFWTEKEASNLIKTLSVPSSELSFEGRYLVLHNETLIQRDSTIDFIYSGDKKASANLWEFKAENILTDVYNKPNGIIEYKTGQNIENAGKAVADEKLFSAFLPKNISSYTFEEKFYAALKDSVLHNGPLFEWCDKGFVEATFHSEKILLTDYKPGQVPSLVLLEKLQNVDSTYLNSEVKHFSGIQLTKDFPSNKEQSFYVLEIADKVVIAETKEIVEKVGLNYQLGNTLALSQSQANNIFSELPSAVNYRHKSSDENYSITLSNKINYTVCKASETQASVANATEMWSVKMRSPIQFCIPIYDHIRKGYSNFVCYQNGQYDLISAEGQTIWSGKSDTTILQKPQVIDIYGNNKHQLLFSAKNKISLLDLNGSMVNGFPYSNAAKVTTEIGTLTWKDTKRFVFGDAAGNVTMLSNKAQELIVSRPFEKNVQKVFAYNSKGVLKYFAQSKTGIKSGDLEKNTVPIIPSWIQSDFPIAKLNRQPAQVSYGPAAINFISATGQATISVGCRILKTENNLFYLKEQNNVLVKNTLGETLIEAKLPFNEVDGIDFLVSGRNKYLLILDGLENNLYLFDETGSLTKGFPKEGSSFGTISLNSKTNVLDVVTVVKNNIICYKLKSKL